MAEETTRSILENRIKQLTARFYSFKLATENACRELHDTHRALAAIGGSPLKLDEIPLIDWGHLEPANSLNSLLSGDDHSFHPKSGAMSIKRMTIDTISTLGRLGAVEGVTSKEIRQFMKDAFDRTVERTSLSPQLTRLRDEGLIVSDDVGRWRLANEIETPPED